MFCFGIAATASSGCAQTMAGGTAQHVCRTWQIVTISKNDKLTDQTARELAGNNAARQAWCNKSKA